MATRKGERSGPPGVGLVAEGENYPCGRVTLEFAGRRVGQATVRAGAFRQAELNAPGDVAPGRQTLTAACGGTPLASTTFVITDPALHRPALVTELPTPADVSFAPEDLAKSAAVALVVIPMIFFPFALIEEVMSKHYDEICGWFGLKARSKPRSGWAAVPEFVLFSTAAAAVYTGLEPHLAFDFNTAVVFVGLLVALCVSVLAEGLPPLFVARRHATRAALQALPGSLLVALAVVALSRLVHFHPGYAFGAVAGFIIAKELGHRTEGKLAAMSILSIMAVSLGAWVAWLPIHQMATVRDPSAAALILESILATTFMVGLETSLVLSLPIRFVPGGDVFRWSRWAWAGLFAVVAFPAVHVLFGGGKSVVGPRGARPAMIIAVSVLFALATVAFWAYFRFRPEREHPPAIA